ncbi:formate dehydrogenase subunit delta [Rhizobium sp. L1K21]|uniref:formate dehydrogenase subunit delta n=1 Tax=Rhizobium sp. L1K21 TaxID=2954933 RepID=UPI0020938EA3|nr:formate dehydrogenase subunit delta [Rhizobium sp. L1K21]MCO6184917.1 formate dehydrogenase subunit delta [Rhizobium sp. L1K21]
MSHDKIVYMANQIAAFFNSQPEAQRAEGVATHINKFWEPRMRRQFFEKLEAGAAFDPLVVKAAELVNRPETA